MTRKTFASIGFGILLVFVLFWLWYSVAANYDYGALSGTYTFNRDSEKCILYLRPNQTFSEELNRGGVTQKAQGRWRRFGEAHMSFSNEFIKVSGQELDYAGEVYGQFDKTLGLFPSLTLVPGGPTFHKKWFR
jgi:hypothetical protein